MADGSPSTAWRASLITLPCGCCVCSYAKTAGKSTRAGWLDFTKDYFVKREALVAVLLLVDASIPPQQVDLECANWLAEAMVGSGPA